MKSEKDEVNSCTQIPDSKVVAVCFPCAENGCKNDSTLFHNRIWLRTDEAAKYLGISEENLRTKVSRGQILPDGRLGKNLRFKKGSLDEQLEASMKQGGL